MRLIRQIYEWPVLYRGSRMAGTNEQYGRNFIDAEVYLQGSQCLEAAMKSYNEHAMVSSIPLHTLGILSSRKVLPETSASPSD